MFSGRHHDTLSVCGKRSPTSRSAPLTPTRTSVIEPVNEGEVRRRIDMALSAQGPFPHGFMASWGLVESRSGVVADAQLALAERLIRG